MADFIIRKGILPSYRGNSGDVVIPDSVTSIGNWAFEGCISLTIYAHAGSYAETYAKENDIKFQVI